MFPSSLSNFLYQTGAKPLFFANNPETVHEIMTNSGELLGEFPLSRWLTQQAFAYNNSKLAKTIDGIYFPNPVGLAAGFDYNAQLTKILASVGFGWQSVGTVTWEAYEGNPKPRLVRLPNSKSLLVNKGLKGPGAKAIAHKLKYSHFSIPVGISIATTNKLFTSTHAQLLDIAKSFALLEKETVNHAYYEMNISCPNTHGGEPFTSPDRLHLLLSILDKLSLTKALYIKMPVDLDDEHILALLYVCQNHNVQGVILGNLWKNKETAELSQTDKVTALQYKGNLSGKPTWKRSNELVALTRKNYPTRFTIIGTGGIFSPEDAQTKLEFGADLIQLITGMIYQGPQLIGQINKHLATSVKPTDSL